MCRKWNAENAQTITGSKEDAEQKGWFLLVFYLSLEHIYSFFMIINNNLMYNFSPQEIKVFPYNLYILIIQFVFGDDGLTFLVLFVFGSFGLVFQGGDWCIGDAGDGCTQRY